MKVSIISGFYNRGAVLERTMRSVLEQDFDDFEFILFDDASSDNTRERVHALEDQFSDHRFRFRAHPSNLGFVSGLKNAIQDSTGEYIAIQGSGDVSLQGRLRMQSEYLDKHPDVGVVGSWYYNVEESTGRRRLRRPSADGMRFHDLLRGNVFSHGEVMIRRSVYDAVGGYRTEFKNAQDYDLWLRIIRVASIATIPAILYERHIQFDGVTYDPRKLATHAKYSRLAKAIAIAESEGSPSLLRRLREEGPEQLLPMSDPELQQKYVKGVIRFAVWGARDDALTLASQTVTNPATRLALTSGVRAYSSPIMRPARAIARRALRITADAG